MRPVFHTVLVLHDPRKVPVWAHLFPRLLLQQLEPILSIKIWVSTVVRLVKHRLSLSDLWAMMVTVMPGT